MQFKLTVGQGVIEVEGPFSRSNNDEWRSLGGKFQDRSWRLPDTDVVRKRLAELFGAKSDEVWALVPAEKVRDGAEAQIGGYVLATRPRRDWAVRMPDGVSLAAGSFASSGGSMKNPRVGLSGSDIVFRLRCRRAFAEANGLAVVQDQPQPSVEI